MKRSILGRIENRPQKDTSIVLKPAAASKQVAQMHPFVRQHCKDSVVTEIQNSIPETSHFAAAQRRNRSNLLEADPDFNDQHAQFNSSRGPPKKRLSPKAGCRTYNKENIFSDQARIAPHLYLHFPSIVTGRQGPTAQDASSYSCVQGVYPAKNDKSLSANFCAKAQHHAQPLDTPAFCYQPQFRPDRNRDSIPRQMTAIPNQRNGPYGYRQSVNAEIPRLPQEEQMTRVPCFQPNSYLNQANSSHQATMVPMAPPILRSCSSNCCEFQHHAFVPPQLKLSISKGQQLISGPIMHTPDSISVAAPRLFSAASSGSATNTMGFHNFSPKVTYSNNLIAAGHPFVSQNNCFHPIYPSQATTHAPTPQQRSGRLHEQPIVDSGRKTCDRRNRRSDTDDHSRKRKAESRNLFDEVPKSDRSCKCAYSRCLQLYGECFGNCRLCNNSLCICTGCSNTESHKVKAGDRELAIEAILARRPDAFESRAHKRTVGSCGCKKSG